MGCVARVVGEPSDFVGGWSSTVLSAILPFKLPWGVAILYICLVPRHNAAVLDHVARGVPQHFVESIETDSLQPTHLFHRARVAHA